MAVQWMIIGVGPGNEQMVTKEALVKLRCAEILIGSKRLLDTFADPDQFKYEISGDLDGLRLNLTAWMDRNIAILVSGDPGFFSILEWLKREFPKISLTVIPGISSMQLAFARMGQSWYDCNFISLHGRMATNLVSEIVHYPKVCILTDDKNTPLQILKQLRAAGVKDKWLFVGSNLGSKEEWSWQGRMNDYQDDNPDSAYSVVIIEDEDLAV